MKKTLLFVALVAVGASLYWFSGGPPDGPYETYHDNGQLWLRGTWKDGMWDGPIELYHENGEVRDKGTYKDDEKCGEWLEEGETVTYDPC